MGRGRAVTGSGGCDSRFEHSLALGDGEIKVYRCDWGWFVKSPYREARSRYLDKALEEVLGKLDRTALRALVDTLDRELTIERNRTGRTASRTLGPETHVA
jgi:hypothetical protein